MKIKSSHAKQQEQISNIYMNLIKYTAQIQNETNKKHKHIYKTTYNNGAPWRGWLWRFYRRHQHRIFVVVLRHSFLSLFPLVV